MSAFPGPQGAASAAPAPDDRPAAVGAASGPLAPGSSVPRFSASPLPSLEAQQRDLLQAFALGWSPRSRAWLHALLRGLGRCSARGRAYTHDELRAAMQSLAAQGLVVEHPARPGHWQVAPALRAALYLQALDRDRPQALLDALAEADLAAPGPYATSYGWGSFGAPETVSGMARLMLHQGLRIEEVERRLRGQRWDPIRWSELLRDAVLEGFDPALFARVDADLRHEIVGQQVESLNEQWTPESIPLLQAAGALLTDEPLTAANALPRLDLRLALAEHALLAGRPHEVRAQLASFAAEAASLALPRATVALHAAAPYTVAPHAAASYAVAPHAAAAPQPAAPPQPAASPGPEDRALQDLGDVHARVFEAALAATDGRFAEASAGFEAALATLQQLTGKRKNLLAPMTAWLYPLSLLAQQTPAHLARALRFCLAECGRKTPTADSPAGSMALAIRMRLGETPRQPAAFAPRSYPAVDLEAVDFWNWLMRAWLADANERRAPSAAERAAAARLRERLLACDLGWLAGQLDAALAVLDGQPALPAFFVPSAQERWRTTLAALAALDPAAAAPRAAATQGADTRIVWRVTLGARGQVTAIEPLEQRRGVRGWSKPKALPLSRLAASETLDPWDARVARAIRQDGYGARRYRLDLAAAIVALAGHPALELADAPGSFVDLVEAAPTVDVLRHGNALQLRVSPQIHGQADDAEPAEDDYEARHRYLSATAAAERKEAEALRLVTVLRESPRRARLVRLTPAQRRAVQLVGNRLVVPRTARAELDAALRALASHFQVQADDLGVRDEAGDAGTTGVAGGTRDAGDGGAMADAAGGREAGTPSGAAAPASGAAGTPGSPATPPLAARTVPPQTRLRAELSPHGEGLALRLVALPLGEDGPRMTPGAGRARLIAAVRGQTLATERDLAGERAGVEAVLDACPMLDPAGSTHCDWSIEQADDALALLEALPALPAVAGLDWPRGKPVEVVSAAPAQLRLQLSGTRNWFALRGGLRVNEQQLVQLEQLLEWSTQGKGRFVPLGEGRYLALTRELRARLDELAAVAELREGEARFAPAAAPWLQAALDGVTLQADRALRERLERLERARTQPVGLPAGLQATLRPYQEDGYAWAMRLAQAGLGACLADDMGLGKTLQALALLLARAPHGPALVVAPTSLCRNWQAEARRFAPALTVRIYGDDAAERGALLASPGPFDVVIASYTLVQQAADAFAAPAWHTLVVDEAQAVKNAGAKRSQALFGLQADFRLALSGTPIENRLAELWSIMRLVNPGLLGPAARFNQRFAAPIERERDREAQRTLRRLIAPFVLRRTKAQVLDDLPPRTELQIDAVPEPDEAAHYEVLRRQALAEAERRLASDGAGQAHLHVLAQLMRLRRAACDPRLVSPELAIAGAKVRAFAALAAELAANGHKTLVFSQFVDFLALLREPLDAAGLRYQYLDGATPAAERARRVAAFQAGEGEFFLISLKAGGFGLNLTAADYVVIADPWWNPAAEDQAMGRAHRIGQRRPVTAYRLVTRGTLEEGIVALHHDKRALAQGVLEGGEHGALPTTEELIALVRGAAPEPPGPALAGERRAPA